MTYGQNINCDKSKLSNSDKKLLIQFWNKFKRAVNSENKTELTTLIKFPFSCDYCVIDTGKERNSPYLKVTKRLFEKGQYKIFLDNKLKKLVNASYILDILSTVSENNKCYYDFSYGSIEPSKITEGQQHFFSLNKINGEFVITSASTVP